VQHFLLPELAFGPRPEAGETVIVHTQDGPAMATVARPLPDEVTTRHPPPAAHEQVVRRATQEDILLRLKQQQREREAFRIGNLRIRARGLPMKLSRVEQQF